MTSREDLIEQATWALIDYDTDVVDRGVRDEHYRERRGDVERVWAVFEKAHAWDDENACPWNCSLPHEHTEGRGTDPYYYRH